MVVADDHPIFRSGLVFELELRPTMRVVGEASTGPEAVGQVLALRPEVAVLDVRMPGFDGVETVERLRASGVTTRFAVLSAFRDQAAIYGAMEAGASAYLLKDASRATIVDAIEAVARGETIITPDAQESLLAELRCHKDRRAAMLSAREREVVQLLADGCSSREIGERLYIAPTTVKTHVERIAEKLGVEGRTAIVAAALRRGIIS